MWHMLMLGVFIYFTNKLAIFDHQSKTQPEKTGGSRICRLTSKVDHAVPIDGSHNKQKTTKCNIKDKYD